MKNAKKSVLKVYPNAYVFEDIRDWGDSRLNATPFAIIDLDEKFRGSESDIEGKIKAPGQDLLHFGHPLTGWIDHIDDAWDYALKHISRKMLEKLQNDL